ncbi:MAG: hypothetical protein KBS45_00100, partial [Clostridiales bacterium]|nr:hypothetical protein [Candidatus Coliplasma caballi]
SMFPDAYRCAAVCPVLKHSDPAAYVHALCEKKKRTEDEGFEKLVASFYPYLVSDASDTAEDVADNVMTLLVINDCEHDVGVLKKLYNVEARNVCELLSTVREYLEWLIRVEKEGGKEHFLRFGADALPLVFAEDLPEAEGQAAVSGGSVPEKLFDLLENCALRLRDPEREEAEKIKEAHRCAFCHAELEEGRYSLFDSKRLLCFDCMTTTVCDDDALASAADFVLGYLKKADPRETFPGDCKVEFMPSQDLEEADAFSEDLFATDEKTRTIRVERDLPLHSVIGAVLHGFIRFWQKDNDLILGDSVGQAYYEELRYLEENGKKPVAAWLRENLPQVVRTSIEQITDGLDADTSLTSSFAYMRMKAAEAAEDVAMVAVSDGALFDPDATPRFWKEFLFTLDDKAPVLYPAVQTKNAAKNAALKNAPPEGEEDVAVATKEEEISLTDTDDGTGTETGEGTGTGDGKKPRYIRVHFKTGEEVFSDELDEKTGKTPNKYSQLYNLIGLHFANFDQSWFDIPAGLTDEDVARCYYFVINDYPEYFWVDWGRYAQSTSPSRMRILLRCLDESGNVEWKRVREYRKQIVRAAQPFIAGISAKKHTPYQALLTVYRRVISSFDYDTKKLRGGYDAHDRAGEDELRSLHSALVGKKVVCVGYAVAMQYLLQSVGIVCAQITSEGHAWNIVRLGNETFCLDATWDDGTKTTADGDQSGQKTFTKYDHCGVQIADLLRMENDENGHHRPEAIFQGSDALNAVIRETSQVYNYFRHEHLYLTSYDEEKVVNAIVYALKNDESAVAMRFTDEKLRDVAFYELQREKREALMAKAKEIACQGAGLSAHKIKKATLGDPVAYLKSDSLYIEINW